MHIHNLIQYASVINDIFKLFVQKFILISRGVFILLLKTIDTTQSFKVFLELYAVKNYFLHRIG